MSIQYIIGFLHYLWSFGEWVWIKMILPLQLPLPSILGAVSWCLVKSSAAGAGGDSAGNVGTLDWLMISCYIEFPVE